MIPTSEIHTEAKRWNLPHETIERDYVLGWVLWGIANHPKLFQNWIFRGGTCLKKCYADHHRYSEDLDFTVLPGGLSDIESVRVALDEILPRIAEVSGIDFSVKPPRLEERPHGGSVEGRVYYRGPLNTPNPMSIKLDIVSTEHVVRPPKLCVIGHPYSDKLPEPNKVRCYNLEELFAEKIRAMGERCRPRDLYDVVYLFRRSDLGAEPDFVQFVLHQKCEAKGLVLPSLESVSTGECRAEMETRWQSMLGHQLGFLPSFDDHWSELPNFFSWLSGEEYEEALPSIAIPEGEAWVSFSSEWQRGQENFFEPVRFAAVNQLCLKLGYQYKFRDIEPYSLRRTRAGFLLLYAIKADTREIRGYRIDRIQSVEVTTRPFRPVFRIEFAESGDLSAPMTRRPRRRLWSSGTTYIVECSYCGKQFRRKKYSVRINAHTQQGSTIPCPGRHGYMVDTY